MAPASRGGPGAGRDGDDAGPRDSPGPRDSSGGGNRSRGGGSASAGRGGARRAGGNRRTDDRGVGERGRRGSPAPHRPDSGPSRQRHQEPELPDEVTGHELDADVTRELSSLSKESRTRVARHLVMAARLVDDDPERGYEHAVAARRVAGRLAVVREAVGLSAYHAGHYDVALAELRAARRISGSDEHWPVMADCERGLGRPERALRMVAGPEADALDAAGRAELRIVAAGARQDLGQPEAALLTLQVPELNSTKRQPWVARLRYAYAEALLTAGRDAEAQTWFRRAVEADLEGVTDAAERVAESEGVVFVDDEYDGAG